MKKSEKSEVAAAAPARHGRGTGIPNPVDVHVGARIRMRRLLLGMNQETLAAKLSLTFQQVQKYEGGGNRVSASRLSHLAEILGVSISYFFNDIDSDPQLRSPEEAALRERLFRPESLELIRLYYAMPSATIRAQFFGMVKTISEDGLTKA